MIGRLGARSANSDVDPSLRIREIEIDRGSTATELFRILQILIALT